MYLALSTELAETVPNGFWLLREAVVEMAFDGVLGRALLIKVGRSQLGFVV